MVRPSTTSVTGPSTDGRWLNFPLAGHAVLKIDVAGTVTSYNEGARLLFALNPDDVSLSAEDLFGPPVGVPGGVRTLLDGFAASPGQPPAWTGNLACFRGPGQPFVVTATAAGELAGPSRTGGGLTVICGPPPARNLASPAAGWLPPDLSRRFGHELRGSLTGIAGLASIMVRRAGVESGDHLRRLKIIDQSARSALATVDQVVELSQLESGRVRCRKVAVDTEQILASAIDLCAALKGPDQHVYSEATAHVRVETDPALATPILAELIANALIAGAATEVRVRTVAEAHLVRLQVADDGRGVPLEEQQTIFDPFVRGVTAADGAAGLGLHLARRRAQMLGAGLTVSSKPGYGSTFTLTLPFDGPGKRQEVR